MIDVHIQCICKLNTIWYGLHCTNALDKAYSCISCSLNYLLSQKLKLLKYDKFNYLTTFFFNESLIIDGSSTVKLEWLWQMMIPVGKLWLFVWLRAYMITHIMIKINFWIVFELQGKVW